MRHFTVESGLPSNNVYSIYKDHFGYLWFATDKGVVRYNGITFEKFTTDDGLPDNDVFYFKEDFQSRLWLCCFNGEMCYFKDGVFHTTANTPILGLINESHAFAAGIEVEKDSTVTFFFSDFKYIFNIRGEKVTTFKLNQSKSNGTDPLIINKISDNRYKVLLRGKAQIVDTLGNIIETIAHKNLINYAQSISQYQYYLRSPSCVYSSDEIPLFSVTNKMLVNSYIYRLYKFDSNWFFGTSNGLFINNDLRILKGNKITEVARDIEGNYWVASLNNGVFWIGKNFLNTQQYNEAYKGGIKYASAQGKLLFFTNANGNLYRMDTDKPKLLVDYTKQLGYRSTNDRELENAPDAVSLGKLIDNKFNYYSIDGTTIFTIDKIDHVPGKTKKSGIFEWTGTIKEMIDGGDLIYLHSSFGIYAIKKSDLSKDVFVNIFKKDVFNHRIYSVAAANGNQLWFSTLDHIYKIVNQKLTVQNQFGKIALKSMQIAGNFLVGITQRNELFVCYDYETKATIITQPGDRCIWDKLYKLNDSSFLVSTDNHYRLLRIFPSSGKADFAVQVIENESLPVQSEYICCNNSFCYFFKNGSITPTRTEDLFVSHLVPQVFFKTMKTKRNTYPAKPGISIKYEDAKNISISFEPFSFGSRYLVCEYSISQDSIDNWRSMDNYEINLFEPSYGVYILKVKARTLSGEFSAPYVLIFTVSKPWWATWWFYLMCGLFIVGTGALVIHRYQKNAAREKSYLQKELSALRLQMNPHFLFNTLNSIYSLSKMSSPRTPDVVHKLSELLSYVTYESAQMLTTIEEELGIIDSYIDLQLIRFEGRLDICKEVITDEPENTIVPLLLLPLIENAFKHGVGARGDQSFIHINLLLAKHILIFDIKNSIATESVRPEGYEGVGLSNIKRQLSLLYKKYSLTTSTKDNIFVLNLTIDLNSYAGDKLSDNRR